MGYSNYVVIIFWISWLIGCGETETIPCHGAVEYQWQDVPAPPAQLREALRTLRTSKIGTKFTNRTENFTVVTLVKPLITNESLCPEDPNGDSDMRKFYKDYFIDANGNLDDLKYFGNVFTGCYYHIMVNEKNQKWLWGPYHYQTNGTFYDTMLSCNITDYHPSDPLHTRAIPISLRVANECYQVIVKLFEFKNKSENENETLKQCQSGQILATQNCTLSLIGCDGGKGNVTIECQRHDSILKLVNVNSVKCGLDKSWKLNVKWTGLTEDGAWYYSMFDQLQKNECNFRQSQLNTWIPATTIGAIYHGALNGTNTPSYYNSAPIDLRIFYAVIPAFVIIIFAYWIWKYITYRSPPKNKWNETKIVFSDPEEAKLHNEIKFEHILLIYARGLDKLMEATHALRDDLEEKCHYQIHDIHSKKEWNEIANLTPTKWIEKMMRNGSKIVWIDTPQLRSRLSDNKLYVNAESQCDLMDSRDIAIPYAVDLARTSLENVNTQYLRHFVVRIKGFEVTDGDDDPLRMFAPFIRYRYPEHLDNLCEQLNK